MTWLVQQLPNIMYVAGSVLFAVATVINMVRAS
jgi:hypothetical protein